MLAHGIKKVCVIGSGVMGSGIAAEIANSRTEVILLDIASPYPDHPNSIVDSAFGKIINPDLNPAASPLIHDSFAKYIKVGNLRDDLALIKDCDLVIEVIVEKLEVKHQLYQQLLPFLKDDAMLASNTSTLPLARLKEKLPKEFARRFIITHFFNPPRFMELLELVSDSDTDHKLLRNISDFITHSLGKTIVNCHDTPGFIANRVGCFLLEMTVRKTLETKLDIAIIDQIFSKLLGFPSTGIFGLYDLIGHDVMELISKSLSSALDKNDEYHGIYKNSEFLLKLKEQGAIGRKAGKGFYRMNIEGGIKVKEVLGADLTYKKLDANLTIPKDIEELTASSYGPFFAKLLGDFFAYNIKLVGKAADRPEDIDTAMKLGYNLKFGPFELLEKFAKYKDFLRLDIPKSTRPMIPANPEIMANDSAKLVKYKDEYVFVLQSKMNILNHDIFNLMIDSIKKCEDDGKDLYISHMGPNFSSGADLKFFKTNIESKNFKAIDDFLNLGQKAMLTLKHSPIFVTSCASGFALGGGCEILLHSNLVIAHKNLVSGLVELGVGLIPSFGGTKEMFLRSHDADILVRNLGNILFQNKSGSGEYFGIDYGINHQICANKNLILDFGIDYAQKNKQHAHSAITLPLISLHEKFDENNLDDLQKEVLKFFQEVANQRNLSEQDLLDLEREEFLKLAKNPSTIVKLSRFV